MQGGNGLPRITWPRVAASLAPCNWRLVSTPGTQRCSPWAWGCLGLASHPCWNGACVPWGGEKHAEEVTLLWVAGLIMAWHPGGLASHTLVGTHLAACCALGCELLDSAFMRQESALTWARATPTFLRTARALGVANSLRVRSPALGLRPRRIIARGPMVLGRCWARARFTPLLERACVPWGT